MVVIVSVTIEMINGLFITMTESLTIVLSFAAGHVRVAILLAILHVRPAMVFEVLASTFYSIVVALALRLAKLLGRSIPITVFAFLCRSSRR